MFNIFKNNEIGSISVHDLYERIGKINLIDIREDYEYKDGHIPSAKNVPMGIILKEPEKYIDKSKEYYIVCKSGARSIKTCKQLISKGYNVVNISGGTSAYIRPLER